LTLQFTGTFKYRIRLSIFGHDIYAGPWNTQPLNISEPISVGSTDISLPDGFSATVSQSGNDYNLAVQWEGMQVFSDSIPVTGSLPVSLQPLKGVIIAGNATLTS